MAAFLLYQWSDAVFLPYILYLLSDGNLQNRLQTQTWTKAFKSQSFNCIFTQLSSLRVFDVPTTYTSQYLYNCKSYTNRVSYKYKCLYIFTSLSSRKLTCFKLQPYADFHCRLHASYDIQQSLPLIEEIKIAKEKNIK